MKYKVSDKVRIKNKEWYEDNCNRYGILECGDYEFFEPMNEYCGEVVTITRVDDCYRVNIDKGAFCWTDEMFEGLVEEEVGLVDKLSSRWVNEFNLPEGYIFKDENGNVINATKIVLEKKKKEYPKTYDECIMFALQGAGYNRAFLLVKLEQLLTCRDAYWKIAGEKMGLGKPWEPRWNDNYQKKWIINFYQDEINLTNGPNVHFILAFPTAEMRDAFYENFRDLIEECKELL